MRKAYHVVVVCLLLSVPATAQSKSDFKVTTKIESSTQFWGGVTFDYFSTKGKREFSPLIRADHGRIDAGKYFAINGGVYAATFLLDKNHPKIANWTRRIIGWAHIGVGVRNLGVK